MKIAKELAKIKLVICLLIWLVSMFNASAMAYNVGVKSGDWVKYSVSMTYSGQGQTVNHAGTVEVDFDTMTSTLITGTLKSYGGDFPNSAAPFSIDTHNWHISSSSISTMGADFLIPIGLNVGDSIPGAGAVEKTEDWNGREAVVTTTSLSGYSAKTWYDQSTGVFLEASASGSWGSVKIKLADTSLFTVGLKILGLDLIIWIVIIVVAIAAVIIGAFFLMQKRRKTSPSQAYIEPPPPPPDNQS